MKFRIIVSLLSLVMLTSGLAGQEKHDSLANAAKHHLARMAFSEASLLLNKILESDSSNIEANYLKAEIYLLYGSNKYQDYKERLQELEADEELTILNAKEAAFLGLWNADSLLHAALKKYPANAELELILFVQELEKGNFHKARINAGSLSDKLIMKFMPYLAIFNYTRSFHQDLTLAYLDTLENMTSDFYHSKNRPLFEILEQLPEGQNPADEFELDYADCGPGMGFIMYDAEGHKIKVELDTGTNGGLFTIHDDSVGKALTGEEFAVIEDGIQYNYMDGPADMYYKLVSFQKPPLDDFLVGYFDGEFSKADGCFSPFAFKGYAISIDPVERKVHLRSEQALDNYLKTTDRYTSVKYINRAGWIYIPCKINGKEVLMMVESGSRDVNLNSMSVRQLGLETYQGSIQWRGKDYPMEKVDFTLEIGNLKHEVKGGLISDFVLGNTFYGMASSGDIGPDFLRNYAFTIDPFQQRLILEERIRED